MSRGTSRSVKCGECRDGFAFARPITMAFQPILDFANGSIFAQEALVRGTNGETAQDILTSVDSQSRYSFDQLCRIKAIEMASDLSLAHDGSNLSINFLPNAVYEPRACIRTTLETAMRVSFPLRCIIFEFTEVEPLDTNHLLNILRSYRAMGFKTAIDDFGAGYAGLALLSRFQPDLVKLDMELIRDIDQSAVKRSIVKGILKILDDLGVRAICEGIETVAEFEVLRDMGIDLMQGFLFARPSLAHIAAPFWPDRTELARTQA
jgi:EAL domain-containing protein (putative c-di-GMP-specific phosphodiesterase class I)